MGGFLKQNLLVIGGIIGVIALVGFILVNFDYEAANKAYNEARSGESSPSPNSSIEETGEKREATGQGSLDNLIPKHVGDFTLQTSEPLKSKPKGNTENRQTTYKSSDGTQVNHVAGFVVAKYAYSAKSAESETFADSFFESAGKGGGLR